jgi:hypothetical protein
MKKKNVLTSINDARFYHINWLSHVEGLIKGYKLDTARTPVIKTDCQFGKWLYNEAQEIRDYSQFKEVEYFHDKVHDNLLNLMLYLDKKVDKNFFNRTKIKKQEIQINIYFEQVKNASFDLLKALNMLEKELKEQLVPRKETDVSIAVSSFTKNKKEKQDEEQEVIDVADENAAAAAIPKTIKQETSTKEEIKEKTPAKKIGKKKMTKEEKSLIDEEIRRILGGS